MTAADDKLKQKFRRQVRQQRLELTEQDINASAAAINYQLWQLPELARANRIAAYVAMNGEASCGAFLSCAWQRRKQTYVPILRKNDMFFAQLAADTNTQNNRYGIPEPIVARKTWLKPKNLDVILLPLVAFDSAGNRLGMGGGFYDRCLRALKHRKHFKRPLLVGVAYSFQRTATIPTESWDIPLDICVTESGVTRF